MKRIIPFLAIIIPVCANGQTRITLEDAIQTALKQRQSVAAARQSVESAKLRAKATALPTPLELNLGYSSVGDLGATDQDLALVATLDSSGVLRAKQRSSQAQVRAAEAEARKTSLLVQSQVLKEYLQLTYESRMVVVSKDLIAIAESLYKATIRKFEEGKVPEIQTSRAEIELNRAKQAAEVTQMQFQVAQSRLSAALGSKGQFETVDPVLTLPTKGPENHPDFLAVRAEIDGAKLDAEIAKKESAPEITLAGLRSPWRAATNTWGLRLQVSWRLGDTKRAQLNAKSLLSEGKAKALELEDALNQAGEQVEAIRVEIQAAQKQTTALESIRATSARLVEKTQRGYIEGFGSLLDVLEATRSLREIEQELALAHLHQGLAISSLIEATGTLLVEVK